MEQIRIYTPEKFKRSPYREVEAGIYAQDGTWAGDTMYVTALRPPETDEALEALLLHFCLLAGEAEEEMHSTGKRVRFIAVMGRSLSDMRTLVASAGKYMAVRQSAYGKHICAQLCIE